MNHTRQTSLLAAGRRGVAAIEFALTAPFILLVMLVGTDLALFVRTVMRMDQAATELALTVTQYPNLYDSDFTNLFNAAQILAGTTPVTGTFGATIISGIVNSGGKQTVAWQKRTGATTFKSLIGLAGAVPVLPDNYVVPAGGTLAAVEVFTPASTWVLSAKIMGGSGSTSVRSYALDQPRLGNLAQITPGNRP